MLKSTLALYVLWDVCLMILGLGFFFFTAYACFYGLVRLAGYFGGQYSEGHAVFVHMAGKIAYSVWYYVAVAIGVAAGLRLLGMGEFPAPPPPLITIFSCVYIFHRTAIHIVERSLDPVDRSGSMTHFLLRVTVQGLSYILCGSICGAVQNIVLDGHGPATVEFFRYFSEAVFMYCILGDLEADTAETVTAVQALMVARIEALRTYIDEIAPLWEAVRRIKAFFEHVVMICAMLVLVLFLRLGWALLTAANSSTSGI